MTLSDQEAIKLVKTPRHKRRIDFYKAHYVIMRAHVTGIGAEALIKNVEYFERKNVTKARQKIMLSNKDALVRVMKPRQKIYTAKGGIESLNLTTPEQIQDFKKYLSSCANNVSLKEYIKQHLQTAFDIDPMGLKWVGINEEGDPFPDYKCITKIYDYQFTGACRQPDYVIFQCTDAEVSEYIASGIITGVEAAEAKTKVFRCVCDGYDRIITWLGGSEPTIVADMPNEFGSVPGEVVSNIPYLDDNGCYYYESCLYEISELLSQYVFNRSTYNLAYLQQVYPIMWMQKQDCPTCGGQGVKAVPNNQEGIPSNTTGSLACPECKGTGVYPHIQNSDTFIWEFNNGQKDSPVPVPPLGIIEGAIESVRFMKENNISSEALMDTTMWGVAKITPNTKPEKTEGGNESGTLGEASMNDEPKKDKLKEFSRWGADSYKWYVDRMGMIKYEQSYKSCTILWGDRYGIESPDEILTRITKAKAANAGQGILQALYEEYLDTKYENNPLERRKYWIMYLAEPFFFYAMAEVMTWQNMPMIQVLEKQYYGEWMCTLTPQFIASIPDDNALPAVQKSMREFVINKYTTDRQTDALLFAADGSLIEIGTSVTLRKPDNDRDSYKVLNVKNNVATIDINGDGVGAPYPLVDLKRVF